MRFESENSDEMDSGTLRQNFTESTKPPREHLPRAEPSRHHGKYATGVEYHVLEFFLWAVPGVHRLAHGASQIPSEPKKCQHPKDSRPHVLDSSINIPLGGWKKPQMLQPWMTKGGT